MIRTATTNDIDALLAIENTCFLGDRLSRRSFRHLLTKGHALTLVDAEGSSLRGYITLLFRRKLSLARVYSIATHPQCMGQKVASGLLRAGERAAREQHCVSMRLEVRKDNRASLRLFKHRGYRVFDEQADYYEDQMDALRLEKQLAPNLPPERSRAPYYRQTLDFTCGPSSLMMAMKGFRPELELSRTLELQLWREATTIFMTAGHGGCGPHGLAIAAHRRGLRCEVYVNGRGAMFKDSVRAEEKREVVQLVHDDFVAQCARKEIPIHHKVVKVKELVRCFEAGAIPLVLISTYRITRERSPHWVVMTGCDDTYIYIHDPDRSAKRTEAECVNAPILREDFDRIARYGRNGEKAVVVLYPPQPPV